MPRKVFVAGEILTASDVNTNLMDQSVMVFDDATARTTAIPTPVEGMVTYLKDTDAVEKFDGSAFVPVGIAPAILQVVSATKTDAFSAGVAAGDTVVVTGLSATITPSSTSSEVLVMLDINGGSNGQNSGWATLVLRNGSGISLGDASGSRRRATAGGTGDATNRATGQSSPIILDTPATTSSVTYTVTICNTALAGQTLTVNRSHDDADNSSHPRTASRITLMEVAG